ncbi:unnamed protein product [Effrenium voratum]|nr:unnamed protein product [Effrenium voratum]
MAELVETANRWPAQENRTNNVEAMRRALECNVVRSLAFAPARSCTTAVLEPFVPSAVTLPAPCTVDVSEQKKGLWQLLGRAKAQRGADEGEELIFGAKQLSKAFVLAGDLGASAQLTEEPWLLLLEETVRLAEKSQLDDVAIMVGCQTLHRLRTSAFAAGRSGPSTRLLAQVFVPETLRRLSKGKLRRLAATVSWMARMAEQVEGHPSLRRRIEDLVVQTAEELPVRKEAGSASGREVGLVCEALSLLRLRSDLFLRYLRYLLRQDWDSVWSPKSLKDAARYLALCECSDKRAWRALALRVDKEPELSPGALADLALSFGTGKTAVWPALARRLAAQAANLGAEEMAVLCRAVLLHPLGTFGDAAEEELAEALLKSLSRRCGDFTPQLLRPICEALLRWRVPLRKPQALAPVLSALARPCALLEPSEALALWSLLGPLVESPPLLQALAGSCQKAVAEAKELQSCVVLLHHLVLAGFLPSRELVASLSWQMRSGEDFVTSARLVALCGRAGFVEELEHLVPAFCALEELPGPALGAALQGLAKAQFRPPKALIRVAHRQIAEQTPQVAAALVTSLWALDFLRSPQEVLRSLGSLDDISQLSLGTQLALCIGTADRVPAHLLPPTWHRWLRELCLDPLDLQQVPPGLLSCPATSWFRILALLSPEAADLVQVASVEPQLEEEEGTLLRPQREVLKWLQQSRLPVSQGHADVFRLRILLPPRTHWRREKRR